MSKLNVLIITYDKDIFNSPEDYSMFRNLSKVKFVNLTFSKCKKKAALGGHHGLALTECFAGNPKSKDVIKISRKYFLIKRNLVKKYFKIKFGRASRYWLKYLAK